MATSTRPQSTTSRASQDAAEKVLIANALTPLVWLLARQAAREALMASRVEQEMQEHDDED